MKSLAFWKRLAPGPQGVDLGQNPSINVLSLIGGTKPANLRYLVFIMRLNGEVSAVWIPIHTSTNPHFVLKSEQLDSSDPSIRTYAGVHFNWDHNSWVLTAQNCYWNSTYWHDNYGNIEITDGDHNLSGVVFSFYDIYGVFD